jgi:hypothetical protein
LNLPRRKEASARKAWKINFNRLNMSRPPAPVDRRTRVAIEAAGRIVSVLLPQRAARRVG